jgi:hypothetical protein
LCPQDDGKIVAQGGRFDTSLQGEPEYSLRVAEPSRRVEGRSPAAASIGSGFVGFIVDERVEYLG